MEIIRPPDAKSWLIWKDPDAWKDWGQEEKGDNRGWDSWMASPTQWTWVWVDSWSWWWTESLACCSPWGHKELDTTEWLNGIELRRNWLGKCWSLCLFCFHAFFKFFLSLLLSKENFLVKYPWVLESEHTDVYYFSNFSCFHIPILIYHWAQLTWSAKYNSSPFSSTTVFHIMVQAPILSHMDTTIPPIRAFCFFIFFSYLKNPIAHTIARMSFSEYKFGSCPFCSESREWLLHG